MSVANLTEVLGYHLVPNMTLYSTDLTNGTLPTFIGENITITVNNGSVYVNSAKVVTPNVLVMEGVVHIIDEYDSPDSFTLAFANICPEFSTLPTPPPKPGPRPNLHFPVPALARAWQSPAAFLLLHQSQLVLQAVLHLPHLPQPGQAAQVVLLRVLSRPVLWALRPSSLLGACSRSCKLLADAKSMYEVACAQCM